MKDDALLDALAEVQGPAVLATVVRTKGSTPRKAGAKMIVGPEGVRAGTIGGGCGEGEVTQVALEVLADGQPRMVEIDLTEDMMSWSPAVCGGVMKVFVELAAPGSASEGEP